MKRFLGLTIFSDILILGGMLANPLLALAESSLSIVYPPAKHETVAEKIFFIGTASPEIPVLIDGKEIENRSKSGHFAPSLPLEIGENIFKIRHGDEELEIVVIRKSTQFTVPEDLAFAKDSLYPNVDIARIPNEPICFNAVARPDAKVSARIGNSKIVLLPQIESIELPANSAVLTAENKPKTNSSVGQYRGCTTLDFPRNYGKPIFELEKDGEIITQEGRGEITILSPKDIQGIEVKADAGVARTGASTNHSRMTPLPKGSRARISGQEGEWLRLDYGAWIKKSETQSLSGNIPPHSIIRGVTSQQQETATEIIFPLQFPVPVEIEQKEDSITLSLHNVTAQTDTIRLDPNPIIKRLDWQQVSPTQIDYTFELNSQQQWGYDLNYEGSTLIFSLRHPPDKIISSNLESLSTRELSNNLSHPTLVKPLKDIKILLDPGHGGQELGAQGPTGYPEKEMNLLIAKLIERELIDLGATVYLTRREDKDVSLQERVAAIDKIEPDLAISIHYNALPDGGDAENTKGISTFWYHTQAHAPSTFLHNYLIEQLDRPNAGVFWNNLALTRPHTAPTILLELGFAINPEEFEWITDSIEQRKLARTIAEGIEKWFDSLK